MKRKLKLNTYSTKDGSFVGVTEIEVDDSKPLPLVLPYPKEFPRPPWFGNEADQERLADWTLAQLDAMDKAIGMPLPDNMLPSSYYPRIRAEKTLSEEERAKAEAEGGNYEPLRKLYPQLARHLNPPKLRSGQRFKPFGSHWDMEMRIVGARSDVYRIRAIWKAAYGKTNRPKDHDQLALKIAAERWEITANAVRKGVSRKKG